MALVNVSSESTSEGFSFWPQHFVSLNYRLDKKDNTIHLRVDTYNRDSNEKNAFWIDILNVPDNLRLIDELREHLANQEPITTVFD